MVGPPKTLQDLRKVEGAVRVTCRACKAVQTLDREELIANRTAFRQSLDWRVVQATLPCSRCLSGDVRVEVDAFGENLPEVRARRAQIRRLNLALQILAEAARRDGVMPIVAVQLALRVLHPYVGDRDLLVTYWTQVTSDTDRPWGGAHQALRWIVTRLLDRKWPVWAEFR